VSPAWTAREAKRWESDIATERVRLLAKKHFDGGLSAKERQRLRKLDHALAELLVPYHMARKQMLNRILRELRSGGLGLAPRGGNRG
jgi:hypothetical protein